MAFGGVCDLRCPQQQARPLARLRAHARCGVRDGEARRLSRRARARQPGRRDIYAASEGAAGGGRRGTTTSTTTPPACVHACGLACATSPRLARCTPPRPCSSASRDRADRAAAHLDGAGRREGRSAGSLGLCKIVRLVPRLFRVRELAGWGCSSSEPHH